jgi:uracil-xanthine permease
MGLRMPTWTVHGDGLRITEGEVVRPDERLNWPLTIGVGMQHVLAMFGATFLVPLLTGFPVATTLFFSGLGTLLFLLVTRGRVPSYLGSSFAFISPVLAAKASDGGMSAALGGIVVTGVLLAIAGVAVHLAGTALLDRLLPPVVTGVIVAFIGLNLAGVAKASITAQPVSGTVTLVALVVFGIALRGFIGRLSVLLGVLVGWVVGVLHGDVDPKRVEALRQADWIGLPFAHGPDGYVLPTFDIAVIVLFLPVVVVLIAENLGHIKAVAAMTGTDLSPVTGRAIAADGVATTIAGLGGGSGTTTYAENIGVMAATRVYSTAAYVVAGITAMLLGFSPKFGALVATVPTGVLGGAGVVLYGLIAVLGARIWVENRVDFRDPLNLFIAAPALIIGAADITLTLGDFSFGGIALGTFGAVVAYQALRPLRARASVPAPAA